MLFSDTLKPGRIICVPALVLLLAPAAPLSAQLVINEFMADNEAIVADPQGEYDDWIELYNAGTQTVDLSGMYLTDQLSSPNRWRFPGGTVLGPGGHLLVWADSDELQTNGLHASFALSAEGEAIGLFSTNGVTLLDSITFGAQIEDVSYGRFPSGGSTWYFMDQPSPGAANVTAQSEPVYFSRLGGILTNAFILRLSTPSDAGEIRYTTDGTPPTAGSTLYNDTSGILIDNSASRRIRARAFQPGLAPGPVRTEAYLAASPELAAFDSNLPLLIIDTFGEEIPRTWWDGSQTLHGDPIATYAAAIETNGTTGRAAVTDPPEYAGRAGMRVRGQSTSDLDKKPYRFELWDEQDGDRDVALLGLPSDADWVLHNPHTDKTFMRNALVFQLSNDMGHYSSRTRFIELFVNETGGQIGGPDSSHYVGVYVLMEQIKRSPDRVAVEPLQPTDSSEPEISGGYVLRHDKNRPEAEFWTWAGRWFYVEPSDEEITPQQKNYIRGYIEEFEAVHQGPSFADPTNGYAKYIDVGSFIDHDFCSEITKEVDAYRLSTYVTKDRGGKLVMSPEWDYNWSLGNNDYTGFNLPTLHHTTGWHRDGWGMDEYRWHSRLMEDPEYRLKYADRWWHLRETVLSDARIAQILDGYYALLNAEAAGRNFSRWDILNSFVGFYWVWPPVPNFYYGGNPAIPCDSADHTYGMQVEWLKNWLAGNGTPSGSCAAEAYAPQYSDRLGWLDDHMADRTAAAPPPALLLNGLPADSGATISIPATLTMTGGPGTIYHTLDGTDPREAFTGNAIGTPYTGSLQLGKTVDVRARIRNGSSWSAMNRAVYADARPLNDLRITEIMYHPRTPGEEYIELKNTGPEPISLYLCAFTDGIRFTFPDILLAQGQHVLVVEDRGAFEARYGTGHNIAGEFEEGSALDNGGEEIVLRDAAGAEIHDFDYSDWYPVTDGRGASLCCIDPGHTNRALWDQKEGWQASSTLGGNPGSDNVPGTVANGSIVISEILTHTDAPGGDWIELHNTTASAIDVGDWFLSDDPDDLKKYQIASGTILPAGGYLVFNQETHFGLTATDPGRRTGFGLSELGERVFLSSGSGTNLAGGYSVSEEFGAADKEVTFGRHLKSAASAAAGDAVDFVSMATQTKGAGNSPPRVPGVVINEIMYHPLLDRDEVGEYIELFNHSSRTVSLYDPAHPANTWKFTQGIDYTFPTGVSIPAGGHLLVVRTDPDLFRLIHSIPPSRPIYGPYTDALANDGERLELSMPVDPEPGFVPYVCIDQVRFSDGRHPVGGDPWPPEADGTLGESLHRVAAAAYGNDVDNWRAGPPTPASPDVNVLEIRTVGTSSSLMWTVDGTLESAPALQGPWSTVPGAVSPHPLSAGNQQAQYFRLRESAAP